MTLPILPAPFPIEVSPPARCPVDVYLGTLRGGPSRRSQESALRQLAGGGDPRLFPWARLRYEHTSGARETVAHTYAPATANRLLCALRGVLRACWRLELIPGDAYLRAIDVAGVSHHTLPAGRVLEEGEVSDLFAACSRLHGAARARDAALLVCLAGCGLRRAEASGLNTGHVSDDGRFLTVRGKGDRERRVPVPGGGKGRLLALTFAQPDGSLPLFPHVGQDGTANGARLGPTGVWRAMQRLRILGGVKPFTPHDLRRTVATRLLDAGVDVLLVQQWLGHANPKTTKRYDRRGEAALTEAARSIILPGEGATT